MSANAGYATLSLIPSARGLSSKINAEAGPEVDKASKSLGSRMSGSLGGVLKKSLKVVGTAAGALLGYSLTKGFQRLTGIENATAKLTGLGHSAKSVDKIMKNALASVKGTAFGLDEAATTAAGAVASGVKPGKALERTLKLVADAATIGGTSMGEMGAIFNKVAASGKVQGDVIAQLGDKGIPILQLLGKALHKNTDDVLAMSKKGQISFADFQKAMSSMSGSALKSGETTTGAFKNLGASLSRIGAGLLSGVFPHFAPAISNLTKAMGPLEDKAAQLGDKIGKVLGPALENAVTNAQDFYAGLTLADPASIGAPLEGYVAAGQKVRTFFTNIIPKVKEFFSNLKGTGDSASSVASVGDSFQKIGQSLAGIDWSQVSTAFGQSASDSISVFSVLIGFLADHLDTLARVLPFLAAGYAAVRVAQAAAQVVAVASIPTRAIQTASNYQLAAALRANTAAVTGNTGAENVGILSRIRGAAATVASTVAQKAAAVATRAYSAAQWLLNVALSANPIGLVIIGLVALGAAVVIAWKKSETFRRIVTAAWDAIKVAASAVARFITTTVPAAFSKMYTAARGKVDSLLSTVKSLPGKIGSALVGMPTLLLEKGTQIVQGLISGIRGMGSRLAGFVKQFIADHIPGPVAKALGIASPSRVMAALARWIPLGLIKGIKSTSPKLDHTMANLVKAPRIPDGGSVLSASAAKASAAKAPQRITGTLDLGNGLRGFVDGVIEDEGAAAGKGY